MGEQALSDVGGFLLRLPVLRSRGQVLTRPCPVPNKRGIYGWYFKEIPPGVPVADCRVFYGLTLLYIGIAPRSPAASQMLRSRIRMHDGGNAFGSTLRLSLGCLLGDKLGIELRRVHSGKSMTFGSGEAKLSAWMADNAFVTWAEAEGPWIEEVELIREESLPLNLLHNDGHPFFPELSRMRKASKAYARSQPIIP
jgi:hypothetical protein